MVSVTNTYETSAVTHFKPDVLAGIYEFEREETPIYSGAKKRNTTATAPEWLNDVLDAAADNAALEGEVFTASAATAPTKSKNHMQILRKVISVTGSTEAIEKYGEKGSELAYQRGKRAREIKRDAEKAIVGNAASVARISTTTAGKMGGIESYAATNVSRGSGGANGGYNSGSGVTTAATDGTQRAFTEDLLLGVLKTGYDNGAKFDQLHVGSYNKLQVSKFSGNSNRTSSDKNTVSNSITVYESDFGTLKVMINPRQRTRTALLIDPNAIAILNLRTLFTKKIAETADSTELALVTEFCTKVVEKGIGVIADLTTSD